MDLTQLAGPVLQVGGATAALLVAIIWCVSKLFKTMTDTYGVIITNLHTEITQLRAEAAADRENCAREIASLQARLQVLEPKQMPVIIERRAT